MFALDLGYRTKGFLTATFRRVTSHPPDNLPELSRPRLLAGLVGLALSYAKASTSRAAAATCPNEQVREESNINSSTGQPYSMGLPECRAYEMVTPLDKQNHDALSPKEGATPIVAGGGSGIEWEDQGDYAGAENYQVNGFSPSNPYVATRTATGWVTRSGYPPVNMIVEPFVADGASGLYSPELATEMVCGATNTTSDQDGPSFRCGSRGEDGAWMFTPIYTSLTDTPFFALSALGGSRTGGVYVMRGERGVPFTSADTSSETCEGNGSNGSCGGIYEVTGIGSSEPQLRLVDVDNAGNMIGPENVNAVGALDKQPSGGAYQAISDDGQTIFFTATPAGGVPTLYARIDAKETVDISDPSPAECNTCNPVPAEGRFQGASANGDKVFFTTTQQLLDSDTDKSTDLYEYNFNEPAGHALTQVSAGGLGDTTPGANADVGGVVAVSEDGSHVYFIAGGVLTTLPNGRGETAQPEADNLYGYDTETNETKFIATLSAADRRLWGELVPEADGAYDSRLAQTTPNGQYLVFDTAAPLITEGPEADTSGANQVWRYAFQTGKLIRVSVGHEGFAANGNVPGHEAVIAPADRDEDAAAATVNETSRTISEDGSTIAFVSTAELQATDHAGGTNTTCVERNRDSGPGCEVYLWHECTAGACADGNAGEVTLISDGVDPEGTIYAGMSADGSNIFFQTWAELVGQDTDSLGDIYDARVDGGFPAPTPEPSCSGEACQGSQSSSPTFGAPGSQSFIGGGNQTALPFKEVVEPETRSKSKPLTNAQKLTKALKQCDKDKAKTKRERCEKAARKKFPPAKRKSTKKR
jgi:hypothetical protein